MKQGQVAGYVRVSDQKLTDEGLRRQDINRQKEKIKAYCKTMEFGEPIFFSDDSISAFKDDYNSRPEFVRMLQEVRANRVKHIIIEDITRWSRRIEDGLKTLREVTDKCKVTSLSEGDIGVTIPEEWFKTTIGLLMAEWSSKIQSYKVQSGMTKRLNDKTKICESCGIVHLGRHPLICKCKTCLKKRGGKSYRGGNKEKARASKG